MMGGGGEGEEKYGIRIGIKMRKGSGARKTNYTDEVHPVCFGKNLIF